MLAQTQVQMLLQTQGMAAEAEGQRVREQQQVAAPTVRRRLLKQLKQYMMISHHHRRRERMQLNKYLDNLLTTGSRRGKGS